jgi:hypothetical protein
MTTLLLDIGNFLSANNLVVTESDVTPEDAILGIGEAAVTMDDVDFYRDFMPLTPDSVVSAYEYPGSPGVPYDAAVHRSVQIIVRGWDPDIVRARTLQIYNLLRAENRIIEFTEARWGQVYLRQPPFKMETDELNRVKYGFNLGITTTSE